MTAVIATSPTSASAPSSAPLISARGLIKCYGDLAAVNGLDFTVHERDFLGFLGPNGAGKTTLMKMIYCLAEPTAGTLEVFGSDVRLNARNVKRRMGVVPQENNLDPDLTVWDNLMIYGRYFGLGGEEFRSWALELLELMQLQDRRDTIITHLSGGMKRRLIIARALLNQPEMVILDEPTTGLDPQVRHLIWDRLLELRSRGITFLLTTHYMDEAQSLCDRLLIMDEGKTVVTGRPLDLVRSHVGEYALELVAGPEIEREIKQKHPELESQRTGQRLYLYASGTEVLATLVAEYSEQQSRLRPASVEDVFLKLTGREIRE